MKGVESVGTKPPHEGHPIMGSSLKAQGPRLKAQLEAQGPRLEAQRW
jgi:hypothetical protein